MDRCTRFLTKCWKRGQWCWKMRQKRFFITIRSGKPTWPGRGHWDPFNIRRISSAGGAASLSERIATTRNKSSARSKTGRSFLHTLTIKVQLFARACGKTNIHSLDLEDLAALTLEDSACAQVPMAGSQHIRRTTRHGALYTLLAQSHGNYGLNRSELARERAYGLRRG